MSIKQLADRGVTACVTGSCGGPLASHIRGFEALLVHEGYAAQTVKVKCALTATLSQWLKRRRLPLTQLDERRIKQFHTSHRAQPRRGDVSTGHQLLSFLRHLGVISALPQTIDRTALGQLTGDYARFLSSERGLAPATVISYAPIVRRFLIEHFADKPLRLQQLRPQDLHRFIVRQVPRGSRSYGRSCREGGGNSEMA
ncbi:MAG: site-specific integrase [Steroidobacteraceae bacterium]